MADPLSVASGIVGLLTTGGKIACQLNAFVRSLNDIPKRLNRLHNECMDFNLVLYQLQDLILHLDHENVSEGAQLMPVEFLQDSLARWLNTFGRLQEYVGEIERKNKMRMMLDYSWEDDGELTEMEMELGKHKMTLATMAGLLNAKKSFEVHAAFMKMQAQMKVFESTTHKMEFEAELGKSNVYRQSAALEGRSIVRTDTTRTTSTMRSIVDVDIRSLRLSEGVLTVAAKSLLQETWEGKHKLGIENSHSGGVEDRLRAMEQLLVKFGVGIDEQQKIIREELEAQQAEHKKSLEEIRTMQATILHELGQHQETTTEALDRQHRKALVVQQEEHHKALESVQRLILDQNDVIKDTFCIKFDEQKKALETLLRTTETNLQSTTLLALVSHREDYRMITENFEKLMAKYLLVEGIIKAKLSEYQRTLGDIPSTVEMNVRTLVSQSTDTQQENTWKVLDILRKMELLCQKISQATTKQRSPRRFHHMRLLLNRILGITRMFPSVFFRIRHRIVYGSKFLAMIILINLLEAVSIGAAALLFRGMLKLPGGNGLGWLLRHSGEFQSYTYSTLLWDALLG